jgi:hypothetical protein
MKGNELISVGSKEDFFSHFPKGCRLEVKNDSLFFIYNPEGDRRWIISTLESVDDQYFFLDLEALIGDIDWHLLMGIAQNLKKTNGTMVDTSISIDVVKRKYMGAISPKQQYNYNTKFNGKKMSRDVDKIGIYHGHSEDIILALKSIKALANTTIDLPDTIEVMDTVQKLVQKFDEGKFEPPEFVIPQKRKKAKLILTPIYQRLKGSSNSGPIEIIK